LEDSRSLYIEKRTIKALYLHIIPKCDISTCTFIHSLRSARMLSSYLPQGFIDASASATTLLKNAPPLYWGLAFLVLVILLRSPSGLYKRRSSQARPNSPDPEKTPASSRSASSFKKPAREPGKWTPSDFKRPTAAPYPDWDIKTTKPLPYRPFKYGKYHVTMGLRMMKWDEWIEMDNQWETFHDIKTKRIEERGTKCCWTSPEGMDGAIELLEELYVPLTLKVLEDDM
jgi:Protein of unknown function (DUF3445)